MTSKTLKIPDHARIDREVGFRVRQRRQALKLSQTWLGEQIGVSFQQIQKYENGRNRISASALVAIANALNCRPSIFFEGIGAHDDAAEGPLYWAYTADGVRAYEALNGLPASALDGVFSIAAIARQAIGEQKARAA